MKREDLVSFIKANNSSFSDKCFDNYSLTDLVILKVSIELDVEKRKRRLGTARFLKNLVYPHTQNFNTKRSAFL